MATDSLQAISQTAEWLLSFKYYFVAFFCGCFAATAELFSRYSHGPGSTFQFKESYMYMALNGFASLAAFTMLKQSGIRVEILDNAPLSQAVFAGFSAMAILRSSVASIKRGESTIEVGLSPVLQAFLDKVDRAFDRRVSQGELTKVKEIMSNVDFAKAVKDLPTTCLNLMQNVNRAESERLGREVLDMAKGELSPQAKALNLGIAIQRVTGTELLKSAVESLGVDILITTQQLGASGQREVLTYQEERIRELKKKLL